MKNFISIFILLAAFVFLSLKNIVAQTPQWKSKVSPAIFTKLNENAAAEFIVVMKEQADLSAVKNIHGKETKGNFVFETLNALAQNSQAQLISDLKNSQTIFHSYWVVNAIAVTGNISLLEKLAARSDVKNILNNTEMSFAKPVLETASNTRDLVIPWGVDSIHAPAVWQMGIKGAGVVVGGEDTGYDWEHPALKNQYRGWNGISVDNNYNWHDAIHAPDPKNVYPNPCGIDIKSPCDDYGHGTHTMGTMIGEDGDLRIGIAPEAKWIGERNMEQGWGNLASYIEAFEWFIAPTDTNNLNADVSKAPHVINNSWVCTGEEGCDVYNFSVMEDVVKNVKASGIVVVASAGNSGPYCNTISLPPAIFEASFSIGAIDLTLTVAGFSSRGNVTADGSGITKPNVTAPGVDVYSSIPNNQYAFYSGTSMAGPHTVGTVALVICANPLLAGEVDQIENIIEETAHPVTTNEGCGGDNNYAIPNNTYGWGIIDALAAVQKAMVFTEADLYANENEINIFPTITHDFLFVNFENGTSNAMFKLFSISGQQIFSNTFYSSKNIVNLENLPAGIYLYQAVCNGKFVSGKIVKQ